MHELLIKLKLSTKLMQPIKDDAYMLSAIAEAKKCPPSRTSYSVGAILVDSSSGTVLSTGYSRELPGNTHAEECCFLKHFGQLLNQDLDQAVLLKDLLSKFTEKRTPVVDAVLYTTMEPCVHRNSGKSSCLELITLVNATNSGLRISRVVLGLAEPLELVPTKNDAIPQLRSRGVSVLRFCRYERECRAPNSHLLDV